jgi:phenylacetate-CoA ligase
MTAPHLLATPTHDQRDALRATLLRAATDYPFYRELFDRTGLTDFEIRADPVSSLTRLPVFEPDWLDRLSNESLALRTYDLGGVELTTGTSRGIQKRRILSEGDLRLDAALVTRLLHLGGVRPGDRAVAMDLSATPLSAAFLEACERLGTQLSVAFSALPRLDSGPLLRLDYTVLIATPALLTRMAPDLTGPARPQSLRLVFYNGDRLPESTAASFRAQGVGVRSLYGLTETSMVGGECAAEHGVHIPPEHALVEVTNEERGSELIVTTMGFSMPLLRYPTGDRVEVIAGTCRCGTPWPRVKVYGRIGDRFSLYDVKVAPEELEALLLQGPDEWLQVILSTGRDGRESMTLRLPSSTRGRRREMIGRLHGHPMIGYLLEARLVSLRFSYVADEQPRRKRALLVDRRGGSD